MVFLKTTPKVALWPTHMHHTYYKMGSSEQDKCHFPLDQRCLLQEPVMSRPTDTPLEKEWVWKVMQPQLRIQMLLPCIFINSALIARDTWGLRGAVALNLCNAVVL